LKITVLGSINQDIVSTAKRLPAVGETVEGLGVKWMPGGKGANQAVQAALLGAETWFVGCVGKDESGGVLEASLKNHGVNTDYLYKIADSQSGICSIFVDQGGRNMLVHSPGANMRVAGGHIEAASHVIADSDFLVMQNEINMDAVEYGLRLAHSRGVKSILNPAPALPLKNELFAMIDFITPNETECEVYTGIGRGGRTLDEWARESSEWFLERGVGGVCITLGEYGAYYRDGKEEALVEAFRIDAIDTTAAGDCFNAGFAVGLAGGANVTDTLRFANACGAVCAMRMGTQPSICSKKEVLVFLYEKGILSLADIQDSSPK
jgi:ribokinase